MIMAVAEWPAHPNCVASRLDDKLIIPPGGFCIGEQLEGELYGTSSRGLQRPGMHPG